MTNQSPDDVSASSQRCGRVSILGLPNSGKSTLLNAAVGAKIAAVSRKIQTTQTPMCGVAVQGDTQIIFQDAPGYFDKSKHGPLNNFVQSTVSACENNIDLLLYLVDGTQGLTTTDEGHLQRLQQRGDPLLVVMTKTDRMKLNLVQERLERIADLLEDHVSVVPLSSKQSSSVKSLMEMISLRLPLADWEYSDETLTDRSTRYLASELIREQLFRQLGNEVPYKCAVQIDQFTESQKGNVVKASVVASSNHLKSMILGSRGSKIKEIRTQAQASIENLTDRPCHLFLHVKAEKDWQLKSHRIAHFLDYSAT